MLGAVTTLAVSSPPAKTFKLEFTSPLATDLNTIRLDPTLADVVILAGESKTPIFAHTLILMHRCEYYKNALSNRWNNSDQDLSIQLDGIAASKNIRTVLSHPDIDAETVNIVLEFIYTGIANVPADYLSRVISFADYLTLESLKSLCLDCWATNVLAPENALELYVLATRMDHKEHQTRALMCIKPAIGGKENLFLKNSAGILKDMEPAELNQLLRFQEFEPWMKWTILIHWSKLKQGCMVEPVNLGITKGYDKVQARTDVKQFLPAVRLFNMSFINFQILVRPYLSIFPSETFQNIAEHYRLNRSEWQERLSSVILKEAAFVALLKRLCAQLRKS